jgi:hypothetical protein
LTTTLHAREGLGTTLLRTVERTALWALQKRKRRRERRRLAAVGSGTELEGAEGKGVESIEWERFLTDYQAPALAIEAAPSPAAVEPPRAATTTPHSTVPSVPILQRLQSLPAVLPLIPSRLGDYFSALPTHLLSSLRRSFSRLSLNLERSFPRFLASLHSPLSRLVALYAPPSSSSTHPSASFSPLSAYTDRTIDRAEAVVERLQERVGGPLRGLKALAEARAEEVEKLKTGGLKAIGWTGKKKVKVEEKRE